MVSIDVRGWVNVYGWKINKKRVEPIVHLSVHFGSVSTSLNLTIEQAVELVAELQAGILAAGVRDGI
jgi:SNF family Na+-dependent transporter